MKISISQKWITALTSIMLMLVVSSIILSTTYINKCITNQEKQEKLRYEYTEISTNMSAASDYLTNEVRNFAVTGDLKYLKLYWQETENTKSREKVISKLKEMNISNNELREITLAKDYSDYLMDTEIKAMKLKLESMGSEYLNNIVVPDRVRNYILNSEEKLMTDEEKNTKSIQILFNDEYLQKKEVIIGAVEKFQKGINERVSEESMNLSFDTRNILFVLECILISAAVLIIITFLVLYKSFIIPVGHYTENLKNIKKETVSVLKPEGSEELQMLGEKFNSLYKKLIDAVNVKSEFLAIMSHELRTPLNTILGYNELLLSMPLNAQQKNAVSMSKFAAENLINIINNILDFSKLENKKYEIENITFNLRENISQIKNMFLNKACEKKLYLNINIDKDVPEIVEGDLGKTNQILVNIISNALKFTDKGGIDINIKKEKENLIRFDVKDTGIGIKSDNTEIIFNPFEQSDVSVTRKFGGTGLGLAICREFADLLGGKIFVKSIYGKGSTFTLIIPLKEAYKKNDGKRVHFNYINMLIVDDDEINRIMEKELLVKYGFKITTAESGFEALELCMKNYYSVILMDIRMKEMDGYETAERIRKQGICTNSYIAALSADRSEREENSCMDDFFTKPLNTEKIAARLAEKFPHRNYEKQETDKEFATDAETLNIKEVLLNFNDDMDLYINILKRFIENYKNFLNESFSLLSKRKYSEADEKFHTLKGLAGSIGADILYKKIQDLRKDIQKKDKKSIKEKEEDLIKCYEATIKEAEKFVADYESSSGYKKEKDKYFQKHRKELNAEKSEKNDENFNEEKECFKNTNENADKKGNCININNIINQENNWENINISENPAQNREIKKIYKKLLEKLENADIESLDYVEKHEDMLKKYLGKEKFIKLKRYSVNYEFEKAHEIIK